LRIIESFFFLLLTSLIPCHVSIISFSYSVMRAFTRRLLRRPPFPASYASFTHRPGPSVNRRTPQRGGEDAEGVAEAQVVSATSASVRESRHAVVPTASHAPESSNDRGGEPLPRRRLVSAVAASRRDQLTKPIILDDVQDTYTLAPSQQQFSGQELWVGTQVLRSNTHARHTNAACVVGGASAIRRIWRTYRIRPNVVYVPNTDPAVPAWCLEADLPTVIVRCSPVAVKRQLLSAEYSDGYAAEFPLPVNTVSDATGLLVDADATATTGTEAAAASAASRPDQPLHGPFGPHAVKAMLVLVGLRIPSNVGALLRAATEMGYDAAVLVNCVDATQEKVLRASDGTALSPTLRIYETDTTAQACVTLLSRIAAQHHLLPLLAVPSQEVDPAFEVAKRFHAYNSRNNDQRKTEGDSHSQSPSSAVQESGLQAPTPPHLGAMVVLGSEAQGLRDLQGTWGVPYQLVTLPLPNPMVDSYNVSVAGSVLLHLFRPAASDHFDRLVALSGEAVADLLPPAADDADDETAEAEVGGDNDRGEEKPEETEPN
jgi:tRNA G18 (ribose-2'-O)-methylase SpoU